ncbi:hypothetical protein FA95DRAFT_1349004 [Auriscalpium vulgare]|uniref:Uncharacterized protein n=1 Tax=Auriscalpium vulgare TaxID=40419 RepID=A0ACB8R182_9AGAM|nr:hypothetical protein FA95DRAFT_1349004 [Auriscalpium vulgare]
MSAALYALLRSSSQPCAHCCLMRCRVVVADPHAPPRTDLFCAGDGKPDPDGRQQDPSMWELLVAREWAADDWAAPTPQVIAHSHSCARRAQSSRCSPRSRLPATARASPCAPNAGGARLVSFNEWGECALQRVAWQRWGGLVCPSALKGRAECEVSMQGSRRRQRNARARVVELFRLCAGLCTRLRRTVIVYSSSSATSESASPAGTPRSVLLWWYRA